MGSGKWIARGLGNWLHGVWLRRDRGGVELAYLTAAPGCRVGLGLVMLIGDDLHRRALVECAVERMSLGIEDPVSYTHLTLPTTPYV